MLLLEVPDTIPSLGLKYLPSPQCPQVTLLHVSVPLLELPSLQLFQVPSQ